MKFHSASKRSAMPRLSKILFFALSILCAASLTAQENFERVPWTTSRFNGTPDPPLPFALERVFADVKLRNPTEMIRVPGTDRWIVVQMNGNVVSFNNSEPRDLQTSLRLSETGGCWRAYAIVFHPSYPQVPECFIQYSSVPKDVDGTRLSRFRVTDVRTPKIDPDSEEVLLTWSSVDHMGGSLHFGPDGYLYFSIGDGQRPNPPDPAGTGQDISDLQASILRIDVDHKQDGLAYRIPDDNPFVKFPSARGEIWAFGVRNPWKMAFRPGTSQLWAADVGWEMMEMIYNVQRGANYGWSVVEGSQPIKLDGQRNAVPITPPTFEYDHTFGRSITGGYFWQSDRLPQLKEAYLFGDYVSGKVWGLRHDGDKVTWHQELANSPYQIICFADAGEGEVLVVSFDGNIFRLVANPLPADANKTFPRKLSETGLFASVADQTPAPGVVPYSINAYHWSDHTTSQQWLAIPDDGRMGIHKREKYDYGQVKGFFDFPRGMVFAKTISYRTDERDPGSTRRLETQVLHRLDRDWRAYNYVWNDEQTDAFLQDNVATYRDLEIRDPDSSNGIRKQTWLHASRDQCMMCHIWRAGSVNGFKVEQINRHHLDEPVNQLEKFEKMDLVNVKLPRNKKAVAPSDSTGSLNDRARRYLDLNCAHCHRRGGGGSAPFVLEARENDPQKLNLFGTEVIQGDFGIKNARVIEPGRPEKSVLLYRMAKHGPGRMPKFGPNLIDQDGVQLIRDWIASMESNLPDQLTNDEVAGLISEANTKFESESFLAKVDQLTRTTESALLVSIAVGEANVHPNARRAIARRMKTHPRGEIRDLFERFLPVDERAKRLGPSIDRQALLAIAGDADRGRKLFFESSHTCRNCHQVNGAGRMVGPDLSQIGSSRKKAQLLTSLLEPSKEIEEKFRGYVLATIDGEVFSGLKVSETESELKLIDLEGKEVTLQLEDVEEIRTLEKSIMPERLLEEFTAQEAADLLAFLSSLRTPE